MSKYIIVCGGVISGSGKGVATASMGLLLKLRGYKVQIVKFDPYLNVSAGILAPREHGECYLCDDGAEVDLDAGHYERICGIKTSSQNICTSGTLYKELILEQEEGKWLGATIQVSPHLTEKIQKRLEELGKDADVVLCEIGGTVGDIESSHFYEAIRQFKQKKDDDVMICMVAPILWVNTVKEFKTKPLQNACRDLQQYGLFPDLLLCRVDRKVPEKILDKVSDVTGVSRSNIFDAPDVNTIYEVPLEFYDRHVDNVIVDKFRLKRNPCRINKYRDLVKKDLSAAPVIEVGVFGKYDNCEEAYISLKEAVHHACLNNDLRYNIIWINSEKIETGEVKLEDLKIDVAIVPGGFDKRGVEGKIKALTHCREHGIPTLGLCLGLQCMVIEYARNVCGLDNANSLEFDKNTPYPVVHYIKGQEAITKKAGTMRLGAYDCELLKGSLAHEIYGKKMISERHRHRYEVNVAFEPQLVEGELIISGRNPESNLVEIVEMDREEHPFYISTQAHPEFKSKLVEPAPLFNALMLAGVKRKNGT